MAQLESEEAAQKAKLDAALKAKQAQRLKNLQRKQDKDKQDADALGKEFQKDLELKAVKKKEEEVLQDVIQYVDFFFFYLFLFVCV